MALGKSLKDFVMGKAREATRNAMQEVAASTVRTLQEKGPYWSGYFANAWEVKPGDVNIPATTPGPSSRRPDTSGSKVLTEPIVPRADLRKGYTIGNSMEYRDIAMDLVPDTNGVYRGDRPGATADRDWYTTLVEGGLMLRINKQVAQAAFKEAFK